jgi:iron only hydrogenase large subunit-like protein
MTFKELYNEVVSEAVKKDPSKLKAYDKLDKYQLDCLLYPEQHTVIWRLKPCPCPPEKQRECEASCEYGAIRPGMEFDDEKCVGCGECVDNCPENNLTDNRQAVPILNAIREGRLVYAMIAPAFLGQYSPEVTPGRLRSAFFKAGFKGMIEVALFADILTLKEALEFDANILKDSDFQLTSCCCPLWIAMIRKVYNKLMPHVPGSVSPMIACGRAIKTLYPDAVTVFIGPCIAKKAEARESDLKGAVDYVLTFREMKDIFDIMQINPEDFDEEDREHSSRAGRIYARTGGVSEAVKTAVSRISPDRKISVRTECADGVKACRNMLDRLLRGETNANFFEGMGCVGGCVGGPKAVIDTEKGTENVNVYGDKAVFESPIDNPYVIKILNRLGFDTVESLLGDSEIFTRHFE